MKPCHLSVLGLALLAAGPAAAQTSAPVVILATASAAPSGIRLKMVQADSALAEPLQQAQRTLSVARKRYAAGLPSSTKCLVMVRVQASDTSFRQVQARVIGWRNGAVQALISPNATAATADLLPVSFPEAAVLDWTFLAANGREEGNFVGKYLDTARQLEALPFR